MFYVTFGIQFTSYQLTVFPVVIRVFRYAVFSVLESFTYRFLALSSAGTIVSMVSRVVKLVDAQLISSAYR